GDNILLDHQAAHVIGPKEQGELSDLQSLRHPGRLDIRDIVEVESSNRLRAQILESASGPNVGQGRVLGLEGPADERRETARLVLELTQSLQMLDALGKRLDVAEHHRAGRTSAQRVPGAVDLQPLLREYLVDGDRLADAVRQDLGAAARQAAHASVLETL